MLIIADARFPERVLKKLSKYGVLIPFASQGQVYEVISGHPDIFLCPVPDGVVSAPNTPDQILEPIKRKGIPVFIGKEPAGDRYPVSARFNAYVGNDCLVYHRSITDEVVIDQCASLKKVEVKQGYARCNLVGVGGFYITSDHGIEKTLKKSGREVLYVDPSPIILPGKKHGFFGGCCGVHGRQFFLAGSLKNFPEGSILKKALGLRGIEIIELYDGPLWDGGSIFFCNPKPMNFQ